MSSFGLVLFGDTPTGFLLLNAAALLAILVLRAREPWRRAVWLLWPTLLLFAAIVGFSDSPTAAAGAVLRLLALVTVSVSFFAATPPTELGESLLAGGWPASRVFIGRHSALHAHHGALGA